MARTLEQLRKQYNSVSHGQSLRGGGPGRGPGPRAKGKPKDIGKTVKRLLSMMGTMGAKPLTRDQMLAFNAKLNKIKAPKKK